MKFTDQQALRPTPDRIRETVFNWLKFDLPGSHCLDLFAGSGVLGFEAASRGASHVTLVENNAVISADIASSIALLNANQMQLLIRDATQLLQQTADIPFDLVFMDPPYQSELLVQSAELLEQKHWLANHAKIYVETDSKNKQIVQALPESWQCIREKTAGQVASYLYQRGV